MAEVRIKTSLASRVSFKNVRSAAMTFTTVFLGIGGAFCKERTGAEPPPPFVPEYSVEQALEGFLKGACGKALGDFTVYETDISPKGGIYYTARGKAAENDFLRWAQH